MNGREILIYLSYYEKGDWDKIYNDIKIKKYDFNNDDVKDVVSKLKSKVVTILDEQYPECLKNAYKPPFVLYYYGDLSLIRNNRSCVAVIGSRESSEYGEKMTRLITSDIAKHFVVVSGLAKGIDACAHQAAINANGKTVAVLGSGIENCYPKCNKELFEKIKKDHLVISEYPDEVEPTKDKFPLRNRLIAALTRTLIVSEAHERSGTSITISYALMNGNEVCCVPYPADTNSLCNRMIKDGARLTESAKDVFDEMGFVEPQIAC